MRTLPTLRRATLVVVLAIGSLTACSSNKSVSSTKADSASSTPGGTSPGDTSPGDTSAAITIPDLSIPDLSIPDLSIPSNVSLPDLSDPEAVIDQIITTLESSGLKVDRDCIKNFMNDAATREKVIEGKGDISPELVQKFTSCIKFG